MATKNIARWKVHGARALKAKFGRCILYVHPVTYGTPYAGWSVVQPNGDKVQGFVDDVAQAKRKAVVRAKERGCGSGSLAGARHTKKRSR